MRRVTGFALLAVLLATDGFAAEGAAGTAPRRGEVTFTPAADEATLPPRFRLAPGRFEFVAQPQATASRQMHLWQVRFPSPVHSPEEANNTVHCEYFLPRGNGPFPGVVVLHILGGDFDLARLVARCLASRGIAALFLKMPYYGPRRTPGSSRRMVSADPQETVAGMTQAVLDVRYATAWLAAQPEVDSARLGIAGISLGGITAALAASMEPRLSRVALILAGGGIGQVAWESRELRRVREGWEARGGTRESFLDTLGQVDPARYAARLRGRQVLMINARDDEIIPPNCTESLWTAAGRPPIVWLQAGHYTAMRYLFESLSRVAALLLEPAPVSGGS